MLDEVPVVVVLPVDAVRASPEATAELAQRIRAACSAQLADFKRPHEVRLVYALPRSTLEKIAKAQLRAALEKVAKAQLRAMLAAEGEAG